MTSDWPVSYTVYDDVTDDDDYDDERDLPVYNYCNYHYYYLITAIINHLTVSS